MRTQDSALDSLYNWTEPILVRGVAWAVGFSFKVDEVLKFGCLAGDPEAKIKASESCRPWLALQ